MKATSSIYPRLVVRTPDGTVRFADGSAEVTAAQARHLDGLDGVQVDTPKRPARGKSDDEK